MEDSARKKLRIKTVFGIAIPLLIMLVTVVMVGASFAWFTDSQEIDISTIMFSTAEAYRVDFNMGNSELWENTEYAGQTALAKDGCIISKSKAYNNPGNESNRAFSFVNVISLDTSDKFVDFTLTIDKATISKKDVGVTRDYSSDTQNIKYAFTWFFKEHVIRGDDKVSNFTIYEDKEKYLPVDTANETLYTPFGKLTFDANGYVVKVNDATTFIDINGNEQPVSNFSVLNAPQQITGFNTRSSLSKLFDFYIVFAPEDLFWSQFFKADLASNASGDNVSYSDKYTVSSLYQDIDTQLITGNLSNQMYYSGMDYLGSTFTFSALIDVEKISESEGA